MGPDAPIYGAALDYSKRRCCSIAYVFPGQQTLNNNMAGVMSGLFME
jgi:hypothetical protein